MGNDPTRDITRYSDPFSQQLGAGQMAAKRLSMRKIKDVLRLRFETGLAQRQIARSCARGKTTVSECLARFERSGLSWLAAAELDEVTLERTLYPPVPTVARAARAFGGCFVGWTQSVARLSEGEIVAIDGKTLRRSYDRRHGQRAIHMVSAWASANRLALGQVATEEKTNEITAIPKLLELLELKGGIDTIDARGCQKAIAEQIVAKGADYVLAVKDNQPYLHAAPRDYFDTARAAAFDRVRASYFEAIDAGHGRCEVRRCWLVEDLSTLPDPHHWSGLRRIGLVEAERHQSEQISRECRYSITSLSGEARHLANAARSHWAIENQLHGVLDVTFREDDSRIRRDNAPANFNTLRQFALNLLKRHPTPKSIKQKRFQAALDDDFRAKVIFQP